MSCNRLINLVEGLEPVIIRVYVLLALIGERQMIHEIDIVIICGKSLPRCAHSRTDASKHWMSRSLKGMCGVEMLNVWFAHQLFEILHLLSEFCLVSLTLEDLVQLILLLERGSKVTIRTLNPRVAI